MRFSRAYFFLLMSIAAFVFYTSQDAREHFFGETQNIDEYQIIFAPFPETPRPGDNSTLNYSVLENSANIYNINAAV